MDSKLPLTLAKAVKGDNLHQPLDFPLGEHQSNSLCGGDELLLVDPVHLEAKGEPFSATKENSPFLPRPVRYPKLPSRILLPVQSRRHDDKPSPVLDRLPTTATTTPKANTGRRRANAISLMNSPARSGHSEGMTRIFDQAQRTDAYRGNAIVDAGVQNSNAQDNHESEVICLRHCNSFSRIPRLQNASTAETTRTNKHVIPSSNSPQARVVQQAALSLLPPLTSTVRVKQKSTNDTRAVTTPPPQSLETPQCNSGSGLGNANYFPAPSAEEEEIGDWTDDEKYLYLVPPSEDSDRSIRDWLNGQPIFMDTVNNDCTAYQDNPAGSRARARSPKTKGRGVCSSASSIAKKIMLREEERRKLRPKSPCSDKSALELQEPKRLFSTLLQPPCRTPRRAAARSNQYCDNWGRLCNSAQPRDGSAKRRGIKYVDGALESDRPSDTAVCDVVRHGSPLSSSSGSASSSGGELGKNCTEQSRESVKATSEESDVRELSPAVQKFRRRRGPTKPNSRQA